MDEGLVTAEVPFERMDPQGPFFEHACHEGNYSIANMLTNARARREAGRRGGGEEGVELTIAPWRSGRSSPPRSEA